MGLGEMERRRKRAKARKKEIEKRKLQIKLKAQTPEWKAAVKKQWAAQREFRIFNARQLYQDLIENPREIHPTLALWCAPQTKREPSKIDIQGFILSTKSQRKEKRDRKEKDLQKVKDKIIEENDEREPAARMRPDAEHFKNYHYIIGHGPPGREPPARKQYEMDVAMWYGTLTQIEFPSLKNKKPKKRENQKWLQEIIDIVKRLFLTIQLGGLHVKTRQGWRPWYNHWEAKTPPLASVLSHGGRVMIQLPKDDRNRFWNWLWLGQGPRESKAYAMYKGRGVDLVTTGRNFAKYYRRAAATHYIDYPVRGEGKPLTEECRKYIVEGGDKLVAISALAGMIHAGVNLPLGGNGNINPLSGLRIYANGEHGHLYLGYCRPTQHRYGGILAGVEDSAPIDIWNPVAYRRNKNIYLWWKAGDKVKLPGRQGKVDWQPKETTNIRDIPGYPHQETHAGWCYGQTGHPHMVGGSGKFSCTGGRKWKDLSWRWPDIGPAKSKNAMLIDLISNRDIYELLLSLDAHDFDPDHLGTMPLRLMHVRNRLSKEPAVELKMDDEKELELKE